MTWYTFFKFVHVLLAVVWVGGAAVVQVYAHLALSSSDGQRKAQFAKDTELVGTRVFVPATLGLLAMGVAMMIDADYPWGMNWTVFGLIVLVASFAVGAGYLGPESGRLATLIEQRGAEAPEVAARIRRIVTVSRVELVFLLAVVWAMVVKPVGNAGWFWGALAVTAVAAGAVVAGYLRSADTVEAPSATATE